MNQIEHRFGKQAAEEWSYVLDFLELSSGFSSNIILVPDAGAARICASELEQYLKTKGQRLEQIEISTPEELQAQFAPWLLEGANIEGAGAIWLASVSTKFDPQHEAWRSAWQWAVARVNERRDELLRRYKIPIFIVTAAWTNEVLQFSAKDWWSIRSMLVTLKPEVVLSDLRLEQRENALEMGRQVLQEDISGDALLDPDIALETAAQLRGVKGEEKMLVRMLERAYNGLMHRQRYAEAEAVAREMLAIEEMMNVSISEKANSLSSIGYSLLGQNRFKEAEKALRTSLEWQEKGGTSLTNRGITMDYLGRVLRESGRLEEAEKAFRTSLEWKKQGGDSSIGRASTMHSLGRLLYNFGRLAEAEKAFRTSLEWKEQGGDSLTGRSITMHELGVVLRSFGRLEEAEKAFRTSLEWKERSEDLLTSRGITMQELGRVLLYSGRLEEAKKIVLQSIEMKKQGNDTSKSIQVTQNLLARVQEKLNHNP
jgi:tetratricopeptide (TPR) repeat protein